VSAENLLGFAGAIEQLGRPADAVVPAEQMLLVTFFLGREEYGAPIAWVREVVRVGEVTRVPQAPPHLRGVTNLRGRVLPVVELRTRLGLEAATLTPRSRIVVVEVRGRILGLLVDVVSQVMRVPVTAVTAAPDEVLSAQTDYNTGVAQLGSRLIILLDLERALLLKE
jgi:purine-binding chemotaxis protein CheW